MTVDEMTYTDGGAVGKITGTANALRNKAAGWMSAWASLGTGYTYAGAVAAVTGVGVAITVGAGIGASYCYATSGKYVSAYNYFSKLSQSSSKKYYMQTVTFLDLITEVSYGAV
jgi:hypothetical protein